MKRAAILVLFLISVISLLATGALAITQEEIPYTTLGDGCYEHVPVERCGATADCFWECQADGSLQYKCTEVHGYCRESSDECVPCDFVALDDPSEYSVCETIPLPTGDFVSGTTSCYEDYLGPGDNELRRTNYTYICENNTHKRSVGQLKKRVNDVGCTEADNINSRWVYDYDGDGYFSYVTEDATPTPPTTIPLIIRPIGADGTLTQYIRSTAPSSDMHWRRFGSSINWEDGCEDAQDDALAHDRCGIASQDSQIRPDSIFCRDRDNDGYGDQCVQAASLSDWEVIGPNTRYKPVHYLRNPTGDCSDFTNSLKEAYFARDNDGDSLYETTFKTCSSFGFDVDVQIYNLPNEESYDCNDNRDDEDNSNKEGCYCDETQLNKQITIDEDTFICADITSTNSITPTNGGVFSLKKIPSVYQWTEIEQRQTPEGTLVPSDDSIGEKGCPKHMCPYITNGNPACASIGAYWGQQNSGNTHPTGTGDSVCEPDNDGIARWTSRTAKAMTALAMIGENMARDSSLDADYTIYCDNARNIIQNEHVNGVELTGGSSFTYLKGLHDSSISDDNIRGCILTLNGNNDRGYIQNLLTPNVFEDDDQLTIYAFPIISQLPTSNKFYFGQDDDDISIDTEWVSGAGNTMHYHRETKTLFILQGKDDVVNPILEQHFNLVLRPNQFVTNTISFIQAPLTYLSNKLTSSTQQTEFNNIIGTLDQFDKLFLGKNTNFYVFSIYEENPINDERFVARLVNPEYEEGEENQFKDYLATLCSDPMNEFGITCAYNAESPTTNPSDPLRTRIGLSDDILLTADDFNDNDFEKWRKWSTTLRLQGNTRGASEQFFETECSTTQDCIDADDANDCFEPVACVVGVCVNEYIEQCNLAPTNPADDGIVTTNTCSNGVDDDGDGLIDFPNDPGCSSRDDTTENNEVFSATVRTSCLADEQVLVQLSSLTNAHVQARGTTPSYEYKVCIPDTFTVATATPSCLGTSFNPPVTVLSLTGTTNAHAIAPGQNVPGSTDVCIYQPTGKFLSCSMQDSCAPQESVLSLSDLTNAHAADPDLVTAYEGANTICCSMSDEPVIDPSLSTGGGLTVNPNPSSGSGGLIVSNPDPDDGGFVGPLP